MDRKNKRVSVQWFEKNGKIRKELKSSKVKNNNAIFCTADILCWMFEVCRFFGSLYIVRVVQFS